MLFLQSHDTTKADREEEALSAVGVIRVQVLNEFSTVAGRKLGMLIDDIREVLTPI